MFKSVLNKTLSRFGTLGERRTRSRKAQTKQRRRRRLWFEALETRDLLAAVCE